MNDLLKTVGGGGLINGLLGGAAGGALVSALTSKKGRKYAGKALAVGGVAALGGLAFKAYQNYQAGRDERPALPRSEFDVAAPATAGTSTGAPTGTNAGSRSLLLVRAMISAAMADGHVSPHERSRILERMQELGLTASERAALEYEFQHPADTIQLAAAANDVPTAVEVYLASLVAIDPDCVAGRRHMQELAALLGLPKDLVATLSGSVQAPERTAA